ncbi:O-antigen ligase family protein [Sediminibacterium sp. TEGAF015]|uniref:O-antigen ligase family protein n=1 Tax=Sediminibacterium sp. TEGAF015 TaxID=575378 RepID=UPI00222F15BC|nr:O-antigen ligase family protein [Sediminibacterium sp. TEGAF015]
MNIDFTKKWLLVFATSFYIVCCCLAILWKEPLWLILPFFVVATGSISFWITRNTEQLYWCFLLVLPLSTEFNFTPGLGLDLPGEPLLIGLTFFMLGSVIYQPSQYRKLFNSGIAKWLVIYFSWMTISACYAENTWLATKFILAKVWYILPLVFLTAFIHTQKPNFKKLAYMLCIPLLFVVIQAQIRHGIYGFEFIAIKKAMAPFFRNHVNYAAMLVCLLPIGWLLHQFSNNSYRKKWIGIALIIGISGLFFAYSRGAWLALLVGILGYYLIRKNVLGTFICLGIITVFISLFLLLTENRFLVFAPEHDETIFHENFSDHLSATVGLKDISNAERFHRWVAGCRMIAERPITGFGANSFYPTYQPYTIAPFKTWVSNNPEHSTIHNYYLLLAVEQGIPALIIFGGFLIYLLLQAQKLFHDFQQSYYRMIAMATGIILLMIASLNLSSDLIETDKIGGLFWLCAGIILTLQQLLKREQSSFADSAIKKPD